MDDRLQWHQTTMAFGSPDNRVFRAKTKKVHVPYKLELVYEEDDDDDDDVDGHLSDQDRENCHHEFIRCVQCRKMILYLRSRDHCQACHDAFRHLCWQSVPVTNQRTDEVERDFLTLRGCFPPETCEGAYSAVQFECEVCGLVRAFCDVRTCRCSICQNNNANN